MKDNHHRQEPPYQGLGFSKQWLSVIAMCALSACGGGGGGDSSPSTPTPDSSAAATSSSSTTLSSSSISSSSSSSSSAQNNFPVTPRTPLYEPMGNKNLFIVGQDMVALGGITDGATSYTNGFMDDAELKGLPVGVTTYLQSMDQQGLTTTFRNEGEMKNAELTVTHKEFADTKPVLAIGYFIGNDYSGITSGKYDANLQALANWITAKNAPTFLRIGYEFNATWTGHPANKAGYINVFRYIVSKFETWGVKNCSFVWQSDGTGSTTDLMTYYPGDDYVDWMAYSHFQSNGSSIIELAKIYHKPVMVAEATPIGYNLAASGDSEGKLAWDAWFNPLLTKIHSEPNIRALAYINDNWPAKAMWASNSFFNKTDSRIQKSHYVKAKIIEELNNGTWLNRAETLQAIGWKEKP